MTSQVAKERSPTVGVPSDTDYSGSTSQTPRTGPSMNSATSSAGMIAVILYVAVAVGAERVAHGPV